MINNDVFIEFIRGFFAFALGIGTTYLTVVYKNRRNVKKNLSPEEREAYLFDRYEKALQSADADLEVMRQKNIEQAEITQQQVTINKEQADQIDKMQGTIDTLREDLVTAQKENRVLQLANIGLVKKYEPAPGSDQ